MHGITKLMDLSQEEFRSHYLGARHSATASLEQELVRSGVKREVSSVPESSSSSSVDWSGVLTTPVKDQVRHSLTHSLTHSISVQLLTITQSLLLKHFHPHSYSLTPLLPYSLIPLLTHSLTHSLTH